MDTTNRLKYGFQVTFIQGSGVINYMRAKHLVSGKKLWIPVVGRKQLSKMFRRKGDAEMYAKLVLIRYQRLLNCREEENEMQKLQS